MKKVVIKGHTGCGGIAATKAVGEHLRGDKDMSVDDLARLNVLVQMERLANHPAYQAHGGGVPIEGYLLHLGSGRLELLEHRGELPEASDSPIPITMGS